MARAHVALQRRLADCFAGRVVSDPREERHYRRILGLDGGPWRDPSDWLLVNWSKPGKHTIRVGRDWSTAPPHLARAARQREQP